MPISTVPSAIRKMVSISAALRPCVSPMRPITMPPIGRATKPRPKVRKAFSSSVISSRAGKEVLADDGGHEAVDGEVVPFEHVADDGGADGAAALG